MTMLLPLALLNWITASTFIRRFPHLLYRQLFCWPQPFWISRVLGIYDDPSIAALADAGQCWPDCIASLAAAGF